jgi:hypothetical protein
MTFLVKTQFGETLGPLATVEDAFVLAHKVGVGASYWLGQTLLGRIVRFTQPRCEPLRDSVGLLGRGS